MISEEKIAEWERIIKLTPSDLEKYPCDDRTRLLSMMKAGLAEDAVPQLIAEVRKLQDWKKILTRYRAWAIGYITRLEKEADWLAEKLSRKIDDCPKVKAKSYCYEAPFCVACWREAAKKAVESE